MVHGKGIADSAGTWFRALLARTSWNVSPGNSGTWTLRSSPRTLGMPGSVEASSTSSRWASHLMAHPALMPAYLLECSRLRVMPAAARPVGGVDYPRTYQEFTAWFSDDAPAANIWETCVGRMASSARNAAAAVAGAPARGCGCAPSAARRPR